LKANFITALKKCWLYTCFCHFFWVFHHSFAIAEYIYIHYQTWNQTQEWNAPW